MASLKAIAERPSPRGRAPHTSTPPSLKSDNAGLTSTPAAAATNNTKKRPPPDALSLLKHRPGFDGAALGSPAAAPASPAAGASASETDPAIANVFYGLKPSPEAVPAKKIPPGRVGSKTTSAASRSSRRVTARTAKSGSPMGSAAVRPLTAGGGRAVGGGKSTLSRTGKDLVYSGEIGGIGARGRESAGEGGAGALSTRILAAGR